LAKVEFNTFKIVEADQDSCVCLEKIKFDDFPSNLEEVSSEAIRARALPFSKEKITSWSSCLEIGACEFSVSS
jgi:hypothetical protein